jgi:hypothetical protein
MELSKILSYRTNEINKAVNELKEKMLLNLQGCSVTIDLDTTINELDKNKLNKHFDDLYAIVTNSRFDKSDDLDKFSKILNEIDAIKLSHLTIFNQVTILRNLLKEIATLKGV